MANSVVTIFENPVKRYYSSFMKSISWIAVKAVYLTQSAFLVALVWI